MPSKDVLGKSFFQKLHFNTAFGLQANHYNALRIKAANPFSCPRFYVLFTFRYPKLRKRQDRASCFRVLGLALYIYIQFRYKYLYPPLYINIRGCCEVYLGVVPLGPQRRENIFEVVKCNLRKSKKMFFFFWK